MIRHLTAILAFSLLALAVACGGDGDGGTSATPSVAAAPDEGDTVRVDLTNWAVTSSATVLEAGAVTFRAVHPEEHDAGHGADDAGQVHQLAVLALPEGAEAGKGQFERVLLNLSHIPPGEEQSGTVTLEPGTYELACLVVEQVGGGEVDHYQKGMFTTITVQ